MTESESAGVDDVKDERRARPYSPSWVNCINSWLEGRGRSSTSIYVGLGLSLAAALIAGVWVEGVYPVGTSLAAQLFIPAMVTLFLTMIHLLDGRADSALATLRPSLRVTEAEYNQLRYQLTTLPAHPTLLWSLAITAMIYLVGILTGERERSIEALSASPIAAGLLVSAYYVGWWVLGAFIYHTVHQLRAISRIYAEHASMSLFAVSPLRAFSGVTALTAVTLVIATYGWTALNPENLSDPASVVIMCLITALAFAAFAWPLLGARQVVATMKAERLDQVSLRIEAAFTEMHERIDSGEIDRLEDLNKVVSVLEIERETLRAIPTWPWQPETLRSLVTALLLPLLLWTFQYVLNVVLGS